jgi:catechol 2,3-dioxygenase-like lactoylglutathione lyase family enzyme
MDNIRIVVNDLEAMKAFFVELGLELEELNVARCVDPRGIRWLRGAMSRRFSSHRHA